MVTLTKTNQCSPANRIWFDDFFTREMDRFFTHNKNTGQALEAAANVWEDDKSLHLEYALPGVVKEQIKVEFENSILKVSAEKSNTEEEKNKNFQRREFAYASYSRSFRLNEKKFKLEGIEAKFENGILTVTLPKLIEEKKEFSKTIEIK